MGKGEQTRAGIVDAALQIAAQQGLEGLTIGQLAEHRQMSKSGVFAHFGSREELQIMSSRPMKPVLLRTFCGPHWPGRGASSV